jgi:hypothetical protein
VARADQKPGRRRAVAPSKPRRPRTVPRGVLTALWLVVATAAAAALVATRTPLGDTRWIPYWLPVGAAVAITTLYALALGVRTGGWPLISSVLALGLTSVAVITGLPVLLAGAAVSTAAMGAVLGVLVTTPAARFVGVVRECALAIVVAVVAALAADAYDAELSSERTGYLVLALALLGALVLVYQLGAGFHGLGTRGLVVVVGGIGLLAVALAYTEALTRWGSPEMIATVEETLSDLRDRFGALPRPLEFLLGLPALAWGVSTRARRRQGWWPCAFGAAGLAGIAVSLLREDRSLVEASLSLGYGAALGLLLGYLVIRVDTFLSGNRGRRARRAEEATAHRPEPKRSAPLL